MHIAQAAMVHEIWENLTSVHEIRGQQTITAQWRTLYRTSADEGEDIDEHVKNTSAKQPFSATDTTSSHTSVPVCTGLTDLC